MKTSENCKALTMFAQAEVLDVNGYLISNWSLETLDCEDDDTVLSFSYTDEDKYVYEFSFLKKAILEASVIGHTVSMVDDVGEIVDIACYSLSALEL